ncbi:TonB-dependent receptor [Larkinella terrae]|uniref:TonB-dependent receptor plug domain-containing protein n=1 Tax=Larkinella terrae TaxID=2025311 RepID=A0A7K0EGE5_9BACT|nr:TonB-dependent receptor [Larkinella terrae]MRS60782.1 TonB-dependent receptor plug domain-containing protein [Larkinella terrae]
MKRLFAVLCLLLFGFSSPGQTRYTVSGFVHEAGPGAALGGVNVYTPDRAFGTITNPSGFFSLTLPEQDSLTLVFSFVGYQTIQQTVPFRSPQQLRVFLTAGQLLRELTVRSATGERTVSDIPQMSQIRISASQIEKIPALLGEKDVLRVLQLLPGVQKGSEGNTGIYVRGGGPDQNLILLDEAVIYNPGHLLGFFSAFNGGVVRTVELTKGGFPARFGGRLSSVIEVNTKEGNSEKLAGEASLGLVSSRLMLEGPLGKKRASTHPASFLIAGRRTYIDLVTRPFATSTTESTQSNTYFYDLNARLNVTLGRKDRFLLSGFGSRDAFVNRQKSGSNPLQGSLNWRNGTATFRWHHLISERAFTNLSLIYTQYHLNVANEDVGLRDTTSLRYALRYRSGIRDLSLKYAVDYFPAHHQFRFGFQTTHHRFTPGAVVTTEDVDPTTPRLFIDALESGLYAEDTWRPVAHWHVNAGFRLSHFLLIRTGTLPRTGKPAGQSEGTSVRAGRPIQYFRPEPRLSVAYLVKPSFSVKASYAMMNQFTHLLSNNGAGLPADLWVPTTSRLLPQQAHQVAVGLARDFTHASHPSRNLAVTLEGYYKILSNSISYVEGASFLQEEPAQPADNKPWEINITSGRSWSYGGEFLVQKKTGRLSGWLGYTLSWAWSQFPALNGGQRFHPRYDRRHDASLVGIYELKPGLTFSWTWVYGTGQALTLPISRFSGFENRPSSSANSGSAQEQLFGPAPNVKEYGGRNSFRAEAYHRLDVGFRFQKQRNRFARTWEVGIYNVYNRRNPFYYSLEGKDQGVGKHSKSVLYKYSLFPMVPSVSYTVSF